jgi:hypothetical protein
MALTVLAYAMSQKPNSFPGLEIMMFGFCKTGGDGMIQYTSAGGCWF